MCASCIHHEELLSFDTTPNPNSFSRLFLILIDHSRLLQVYNIISYDFLVTCPYLSSRRLIIITRVLTLTLNICPHFPSYNSFLFWWQRSSRKEIMLGYNKNYATLVFNCILKNSKAIISTLKIERRNGKS